MQPKELFGVIIRTIGLLAIIASVFAFVAALATKQGQQLVEAFAYLLVGLSLMLGPSTIVDWSYSVELGDKDAGNSSGQAKGEE